MQPHDVHRAAEEQYREVSRLTQLNHQAQRAQARAAASSVVEAARWRLVLGRSLIRLGVRLGASPAPPCS